jgi:hypothetical protein
MSASPRSINSLKADGLTPDHRPIFDQAIPNRLIYNVDLPIIRR